MIRLIDVYKAFGPKRVLEGFTLDVPEGETMVIIGYSGTGKSVAIKHIVGLLEPDEGEVWVDGLNVPELSRRELYALRANRLRLPVRRAVRLLHPRRERVDGAAQAGGAQRARDRAARRGSARPGRSSRRAGAIPRRTVGGNAQARRYRTRHRTPSEIHPVRRADDGPRSGDERRHRSAHG